MVQMERLALSPLFYIIALGGQHAMLHAGSGLATSTAVPFTAAILVTRFLHTLWMYYQQKRQLAKIKAGAIVRVADLPPPLAPSLACDAKVSQPDSLPPTAPRVEVPEPAEHR